MRVKVIEGNTVALLVAKRGGRGGGGERKRMSDDEINKAFLLKNMSITFAT